MSDHSSPVTADSPDGPCFYCGEPTVSYAGNPGLWPLRFCQRDGTGITRYHHTHCVTDRLNTPAQRQPGRQGRPDPAGYWRDMYTDLLKRVYAGEFAQCAPDGEWHHGYRDGLRDGRKISEELGPAQTPLRLAAQRFVDLFVWESNEETGEIEPHLDRQFPDFATCVTAIRDALAVTSTNSGGA